MEFAQVTLRAFQFFWTLLITALIGNVIDDAFNGNPASINYSIFVAVFSWLVLLYGLLSAIIEAFNIPIILLAADGLAALFTLIAGITLAAELGVHSCSNFGYTITNHMTNGAGDLERRCRELQASTAFFWFLFACYMGSLALGVMNRGGSSISSSRGGARKGPVMTQA